ncbi:hypothetical protein ABT346_15465 [Micromonospora peucetia]|uniref:hypothetical protein n=1 Tax=Micromonospora peucetia TaxID=47871 RepID=UPI003322545B
MAFRTWGRLLLTALGVSLLAGAGQLGIAFGFGIVRLTGTFTGTTVNQWPAQLVWAGWFAANAAVVGAVLTERLARRDGGLANTGRRLAVAGAAALGATVVAPLCMQPARAAELVSMDPVWAVGICAILGALAGAAAALAVLLQPPVGWNMAAVAGAAWLLALVSVAPSLASTGPLDTVRLGALEPASLDAGTAQRLALVVLPLVALLTGAATGGLARWRGHPPLVSGATGVAGPVLVAFAYLTAGPGDTADRYQLTPYYAALLAVAAGALGSAAAALLRWPLVTRTAPTGAIEPTDILRPLPTGPALPRSQASTGGDGPETVDLSGAGLAVAGQAGDAGSGGIAAPADDDPAARAVPPHWDWPAAGGATPAPAADARTDADPQWTAGSPVPVSENPPVPGSPAEPESVATRNSVDEHTATAPTVSTSPAARGPAEAPPAEATTTVDQLAGETTSAGGPTPTGRPVEAVSAQQPAEEVLPAGQPTGGATTAGQAVEGPTPAERAEVVAAAQAAPSTPKPRRTRKPRSTRQPAAVAPEGADPMPVTADAPTTGATTPAAPAGVPTPGTEPAPPAGTVDLLDTTTATTSAPTAETGTTTAGTTGTTGRDVESDSDAASRSARPPAPAWPVPPQVPGGPAARAEQPATDPAPKPAPRPRHRAPMPDLARAASWEALATARQGGPVPTPVEAAPENGTHSVGAAAPSAGPASPVEAEQPAGRSRSRLGLFRRNRARAEDAPADRETEQLPAQDEEYVDWVSGLSEPVADNEPEQESGRRSLRSTGRHQRD